MLDRNTVALSETVTTLEESYPGRIGGLECDITEPDMISSAFDVAQSHDQTLRIVVCCAGTAAAERTLARDGSQHSLETWQRLIAVNLTGTFNTVTAAAKAMSTNEPLDDGVRGLIIMTASVAAYDGQIGQLAYAATKGGIVSMTLPMARDLAPVGIRVVTIAPGIMDTPLLGQLPDEVRSKLGSSVPFPKRMGTPSDFGSLVKAIAENDYLNGEVIRLDGAIRLPPSP
jgi:NAD(P)-dependent dehydrogenase (short-subunit alcohol dehydrogenase family)